MRLATVALLGLALLAGCGGDDAPPGPSEVRACLKQDGFRVLGGPRSPRDSNAPDTELIAGGKAARAFLAFYDDETRAERLEPRLAKRAKRFDGVVERSGALTVIWVRGKDSEDAGRIEACIR